MGSGTKYTPEFRADTVRMVIEHARPIREVADEKKRVEGNLAGSFGESCQLRSGELRPVHWYEVIAAQEKLNPEISVRLMCQTAQVSPSGFRRWRDTRPVVAVRHGDLAVDIETVWRGSGSTYGSERVHAELGRRGQQRCC